MLITRKSFTAELPKIITAINEADFLAIDAEMSGLGPNIDYIDDLQSRYEKVKSAATDYQLLQYGVCTFKWDSSKGIYLAQPFYSYLFPSNRNHFKSSPSSLAFLRKFKFDFNDWIDHGLPYLSSQEIDVKRSKINDFTYQKLVLNEKDKEWMSVKLDDITNWLQNSNENTLTINNVNSYHRRLLYQTIPEETNGHVAVEGGPDHNSISFRKVKDEDIVTPDEIQKKKSLRDLESNIGFYKIIEAIINAKKPVIGHNSLLDMCHTFNSFCETLPVSVNEFKEKLSINFPKLFDTKLISVTFPDLQSIIPQTALGDIYASVCKEPFQYPNYEIDPAFQSFEADDSLLHSAGYDAFMTGVIFLKMFGVVTKCSKDSPIDLKNDRIAECLNKIYLMRSDIPYFKTDALQDMPSRDHIFRIYDFPKDWKTDDIIESFKKVSTVGVKWIDHTSAFVVVKDTTKTSDILNWCGAKKKKKRPFSVETYMAYYKRSLDAAPSAKRKLDDMEDRDIIKKQKYTGKECTIS